MSRDAHPAQLADAVGDEGQRRAVAGEFQRQLPGAAGLLQPGCRLRPVDLSPAVQQHDELRLVAAVRQGTALGLRRAADRWTRSSAGGSWPGINSRFRRRAGHVHLRAGRDVPGLGDRAGFPRRQQLPAERHLRPVAPGGEQTINNWFNRDGVTVPTDPSQPFGNAERNTVRGPKFRQFDLAASKRLRRRPRARSSSAGGLQPVQPHEFPRAERRPQRGRLRDHHRTFDPGSCSSGSSCCGKFEVDPRTGGLRRDDTRAGFELDTSPLSEAAECGYQWQRVIEIWAEHPPRSDDPPERVWP